MSIEEQNSQSRHLTDKKLIAYETEKSLIAGQWSTMLAALFLGGMVFVLLPYMKQKSSGKATVKVTQIKTLERKAEKKEIEKPKPKVVENKQRTQSKKVTKLKKIMPQAPPKVAPMPKLKLSTNLSASLALPQVEFKHDLEFKAQPTVVVQQAVEEAPVVEVGTVDTGIDIGKDFYGVGELDKPLKARRRVAPIYPRKARRLHKEGVVRVSFIVDEKGRTSEFKILEARPPGYFEKSALNAVKKWRFNPGTVDGQPVKVRVDLPLQFQLR